MTNTDRAVSYGRYELKLMPSSDSWRGMAYWGNVPIAPGLREATRDEVIVSLKAQVDAVEQEYREVRERDGFPSVAEVHMALKQIAISRGQDAMLHAHMRAPDMCLTASELAAAAGSQHYEAANSQYGMLGKRLAEELRWTPAPYDGLITWTFALATGADAAGTPIIEAGPESQHWRWRMRPQVAQAVGLLDARP